MKFNKIKKNIIKNKYILFLIIILIIIIIIFFLIYFSKKYERFYDDNIDPYQYLSPPNNTNIFDDIKISNFIIAYNKCAKIASSVLKLPINIKHPYQNDTMVKYLQNTVTIDELEYYTANCSWPYNKYMDKWLNDNNSEISELQQFFGTGHLATIDNLKKIFPVRTAYSLLMEQSESNLIPQPPSYLIFSNIKEDDTSESLDNDKEILNDSCKNSDDYENYKYLVKPPDAGYNWSDDTINKFVPFGISNTNKILTTPDTTLHPGPPFNNDPIYQFYKGFLTENEAKYYIKNGKFDYPNYVKDWLVNNPDKYLNKVTIFNNKNTLDNVIITFPPLLIYGWFIYPTEQNNNPLPKSVQYFNGTLSPPQPNNDPDCNRI